MTTNERRNIDNGDDLTQPLYVPNWNGSTNEQQTVPAPPASYTPEGDAKYQLGAGNMFVGIAVVCAFGSIFAAKMFDLHPAGYLYGYIWVIIGLLTCVGFKTDSMYPSEAVAWKASSNKMIAAGVSFGFTALVWLSPLLVR